MLHFHRALLIYAMTAMVNMTCAHAAPKNAESYSAATAKQERCKGDAEVTEAFYGAEPDLVRKAYSDTDRKLKAKELSKKKADDLRFLIYQGYSAKSGKEAYMRGWSACMDEKYDFK